MKRIAVLVVIGLLLVAGCGRTPCDPEPEPVPHPIPPDHVDMPVVLNLDGAEN